MQTITIQYRPLLFPWKRTLSGSFPETVQELTAAQMCAVTGLMNENASENTFIAKMTGFPQRLVNRMSQFHRFNIMQLFTLFNELHPHNQFIIDTIQCRNTKFTAPGAKLKGVTFGQFIFAESLYATWLETRLPADLHRFVAALYLPAGEPVFTEDVIGKNAPLLASAPVEIAEAVAVNYRMIHLWLSNAYPLIFPEDESPDSYTVPLAKGDERSGGGNSEKTSATWLKIFRHLVGDDIVNEDKYAQLPVNNVLRFMSEKIKENMKRRK